jgi:hypothetical protein
MNMWAAINIFLLLASACCFISAYRKTSNNKAINLVIAGLLICATATASALIYVA